MNREKGETGAAGAGKNSKPRQLGTTVQSKGKAPLRKNSPAEGLKGNKPVPAADKVSKKRPLAAVAVESADPIPLNKKTAKGITEKADAEKVDADKIKNHRSKEAYQRRREKVRAKRKASKALARGETVKDSKGDASDNAEEEE